MRNILKDKQYLAPMAFNAIEYYDLSLYGFLSPILISVFLPNIDPINATIIALLTYPIGIISKPIGAYIIGSIGDKYGRKKALAFAIAGMGIATGMISILPSYETIGILAPILFAFLRMMQMFFIAGEYNGGVIFALEHVNSDKKSFISGLYCSITVVGVTIAALASTLVMHYGKEYWRIPYFISFFSSLIALYVRLTMLESPEFLKDKKKFKFDFWEHKKQICTAMILSFAFGAIYNSSSIFMLNFIPLVTDISKASTNLINTYSLFFYMIALPIFGYLADKFGNKQVMIFACILMIVFSCFFMDMVYTKILYMIIAMKMIFALIKAAFIAPLHAFMQSMFEVKKRYTMISLSYSVGSQIGGFAPAIYMYFWHKKSITHFPSIFLAITSILALTALLSYKASSKSVK